MDIGGIFDGLALLMNWQVILIMIIGLLFGTVTGAIPGFATPLAISVMLPITFSMEPLVAMVFLTAIYAGGNFGSSISAILLNIPGSSQAIVTGLDGYPMTKKGRANEALGVGLFSSAIGNLFGAIALLFVMPLLVAFALRFGPPELFLVGIVGLTIVASLHPSLLKGIIAGAFGVLIGTIGVSTTGALRGTYGFFELMEGIPLIPALIGLIGFSELFALLQKKELVDTKYQTNSNLSVRDTLSQIIKGYLTAIKYKVNLLRSSIIGLLVGILPGAGATISSVISYNEAQKYSKNKEEFGKGNPEGVVAAESANNASEGGALALLLSLGIPGGMATAVLIGALMLQGLTPGPRLFTDNPDLVYGIMLAQILSSFLLIFVGLIVVYFAAKVVNIPLKVLIPIITVVSIIGTYAINESMFDVKVMLIFAAIGILLRWFDYPLIAVILGLVLAPILDSQLLRIYQSGYDYTLFFTRPISLVLLVLILLSLIPTLKKIIVMWKKILVR